MVPVDFAVVRKVDLDTGFVVVRPILFVCSVVELLMVDLAFMVLSLIVVVGFLVVPPNVTTDDNVVDRPDVSTFVGVLAVVVGAVAVVVVSGPAEAFAVVLPMALSVGFGYSDSLSVVDDITFVVTSFISVCELLELILAVVVVVVVASTCNPLVVVLMVGFVDDIFVTVACMWSSNRSVS